MLPLGHIFRKLFNTSGKFLKRISSITNLKQINLKGKLHAVSEEMAVFYLLNFYYLFNFQFLSAYRFL